MTPSPNLALQRNGATVARSYAAKMSWQSRVLGWQGNGGYLLALGVEKPVKYVGCGSEDFFPVFRVDLYCCFDFLWWVVRRSYAHLIQPLVAPPASLTVAKRLTDNLSQAQPNRCIPHASLPSWLRTPLIGGYA